MLLDHRDHWSKAPGLFFEYKPLRSMCIIFGHKPYICFNRIFKQSFICSYNLMFIFNHIYMYMNNMKQFILIMILLFTFLSASTHWFVTEDGKIEAQVNI